MSTLTVGTADLRQALLSVAPHASRIPDDSTLYRVRLDIGDQNLSVSATNRYSAGHAIVSIEDRDDELTEVDLSPTDVKEILSLFKSATKPNGDDVGDTVRLDVSEDRFTVTDTGGLFEGKSLALPRYPQADKYPSVPRVISEAMLRRHVGTEQLHTNGQLLGLFTAAAKAYGKPLIIEPTGKVSTLVIACGESFLGLLTPMRPSDEEAAQEREWRAAWSRRFQDLSDLALVSR